MRVVKLGIEWGAAYEEAQPIAIRHAGVQIIIYTKENGDIEIELPTDTKIAWDDKGLIATIEL